MLRVLTLSVQQSQARSTPSTIINLKVSENCACLSSEDGLMKFQSSEFLSTTVDVSCVKTEASM